MVLTRVAIAFTLAMLALGEARAEATYQQTLEFLKDKLNVNEAPRHHSPSKLDFTSEFRLIEVSKCNFNYAKTFFFENGKIETVYHYFRASEIDPTSINYDNSSMFFNVIRRKKLIRVVSKFNFSHIYSGTQYMNSLAIFNVLPPRDVNIEKSVRAFRHLIKLCGGKGELF